MIGRWCGKTPTVIVDVVRREQAPADERGNRLAAAHLTARRTSRGKPCIKGVGSFSVSDTDEWKAYAFANRKYVGIDLEACDRDDLPNISRRLGHIVVGDDSVEVDFLTSWVVKEACLKALGLGVWPWIREVRLLSRQGPEGTHPGVTAFETSIGRIRMRAVTMEVGPCLLGIAFTTSIELDAIRLHHDGAVVVIESV